MQEAQEVSSLVKLLTSEAAWLIHKFVFLSGSRVLAGLSFHPLIHSFTDERSYVLFFFGYAAQHVSSPTRDGTRVPAVKCGVLTTGPPGKPLSYIFGGSCALV